MMGTSLMDLNLFEKKCLLTGIKIRLCCRIEVGVKQLTALVTEEQDVVLFYIFGGLPPVLKRVKWFNDSDKYVRSMSFDPTATWLLVTTTDVSLYIIPALHIVDSKQKIDCKWKLNDLTYFPKHEKTANSVPTALIWWQTLDSNQNAIIGHEDGNISFVSLTDGQNIGLCSISEAIKTLHICQDNTQDSVTLLITNANQQQWRLLLEQRSTGFIWTPECSNESKVGRSRLQGLKQLSVEKLASLKAKLAETRARGLSSSSKTVAEDQKSTGSNDSNSSQTDSSIPERLSHLYETYLAPQFARNRHLFSGYYKPTSILTIHSIDIDVIPMFVHKLFPSCREILVTDRFFYIVNEEKNKLSVVSCQFSESRLDGDTEFNPESLVAEFDFEGAEQIIALFKLNDLSLQGDSEYETLKKAQKLFSLSKSEADINIRRPKTDTCVLVTNCNVYKVVLSGSVIDKFVGLVNEELMLDKAERLATMFGLSLQQLLEYSADLLLSQEKFARAIALYRLSKCRILKSVLKFAVSGHCQELLSYIMVCLSATNTDMSVSTKRHLSNLAIMSYTELLLRSSSNVQQALSVHKQFQEFLRLNEYYDEVLAVNVLCQTNLWSMLSYLGRIRYVSFDIIDVLAKALKSPPAEVTAPLNEFQPISDSFHECISDAIYLQCILCKPSYCKSYVNYIKDNLNHFSVDILLKLSNSLDPSQPIAWPIFSKVFQRHRNQQSSSLDSTLDSVESEPPDQLLQTTTDLLETFICVLVVLIQRMKADNFDIELLNLVEVEKGVKTIPRSISGVLSPKPRILSCGYNHVGLVRNSNLYTWGSAAYGCLGLGPMITKYGLPQQVELLSSYQVEVIGISCGKCHTVTLTNYGLYVWGSNTYGQLGVGRAVHQASYPVLLECLATHHIVDMVCGQYHTLALTSEGQIYSWGWGVYGQLGHGSVEDVYEPRLVEFFRDRIVTQVSAGHAHSIVLTSDGTVYSFGSNNFGQLGNGTALKSSTPVHILLNEKISLIATAYFHNLAIDFENRLYVWGASPQVLRQQVHNYKRTKLTQQYEKNIDIAPIDWSLTTPFSIDNRHLFPSLVSTENVDGQIVKLATGCSHSALLTKSGFLYTWGQNFEGQLGNNSRNEVLAPALLKINPISTFSSLNVDNMEFPLKCSYVSCGAEFTIAIDQVGKVLGWGNNSKAQLGKISEEEEKSLEGKMVMLKTTKRILKIPKTGQNTKEIQNIPSQQITYKGQLYSNNSSQFFSLPKIENRVRIIEKSSRPVHVFGQKTLHYVLENYFNFYDTELVLHKSVEYKNFQAASKISYLDGHYSDSLGFLLNSFRHFMDRCTLDLSRATENGKLTGCKAAAAKQTLKTGLPLSVISSSCSLDSIKLFNDDFFSQGGIEELCDALVSDETAAQHSSKALETSAEKALDIKTTLINKLDLAKVVPVENLVALQESSDETIANFATNETKSPISSDVIRKTVVNYVESLDLHTLTNCQNANSAGHVANPPETNNIHVDESNNIVTNAEVVSQAAAIVEFYCCNPQIIENHILMQNILIRLMSFWLSNNLPVDTLETILLKNMEKYFYPLSILLFCKNFNNNLGEGIVKDDGDQKTQRSCEFLKQLSTKFCLQLCSMVLQNVNKS